MKKLLLLLTFVITTQIAFAQDKEAEKLKACGTTKVNYKASTDKKQHPTPEAPADKALIYVFTSDDYGQQNSVKTCS